MSKDNVIPLRPRRVPVNDAPEPEDSGVVQRFPVDVRGDIAFSRLVLGLASVGLTVRVDSRTGRVLITDDD